MEIRTNKTRDSRNTRIVPPPDKARPRKKASQKPSNGAFSGRRIVATLKVMGKLCILLLAGAITISVFIYAYNANTFNLVHIRIKGCKELNPARLEEIIRGKFSANILRLDLHEIKAQLEQETWIQQAEVRRLLPSDLIVYVQERTPSVILEMHGELMVADKAGILLGHYEQKFGKLDVPVLKGLLGDDAETYVLYQDENTARIHRALAMLSEIEAGLPQYTKMISEVDISDPKNIKIMLVDGTPEIYLGEKDYLKRFRKFVKYSELKDQYAEIKSIDLRFDHLIKYEPVKPVGGSLQK